jgi:PAS domain S-box-containing protein
MGCEAIYRRLFETAHDGILILDAETGQVIDVNPSFEELLNYSRAELLGKAIWEIGLFEDATGTRRAFCELLDKLHVRYENLLLLTKGGPPVAVRLIGHVHHVNGEEIIECNIRAMNRQDDADEIERKIRQAQRMEAVGKLAGGVAHDLNNLVGGILGHCDLLNEEESLPEPVRGMIAEIRNTGTSAKNLVEMLLAFSSGQELASVPLDLNETMSRMEKMLDRLVGERIQLVSLPGRNLGRISANPSQIDQVLMNLVINARDAMPNGGEIDIATMNTDIDESDSRQSSSTKPGRYVMLTVSDTGAGMDQKTQARIFEPFFSTKPLGQGSGLGLPTVFGIVEQCGGTIAVYSEPGAGSTFKILFPRLNETPGARKQEEADSVRGGTETILVVDDSLPLRKLMRRFLADSGYTVLDSGDPAEALRKAAEYSGPIPLVITDMVLPGFSGSALAERVTEARPNTKVLYASGYKRDLIVPSPAFGPDHAFLAKPFTQEELLRMVRRLLDSPVNPTP